MALKEKDIVTKELLTAIRNYKTYLDSSIGKDNAKKITNAFISTDYNDNELRNKLNDLEIEIKYS